jgi:aspartate racemase
MLGILGGMGPMATADFMAKIVAATPSAVDQEHLPVVVYSNPGIPDRTRYILDNRQPNPLPHLIAAAAALERAGATCLAMPCNTAHYWADDLRRAVGLPIIHIADAACSALPEGIVPGDAVAVVCTHGTRRAGFYRERLESRGLRCLWCDDDEMRRCVDPVIDAVKGGKPWPTSALLGDLLAALEAKGAKAILLACTELPIALAASPRTVRCPVVDTTHALAQACVRWGLGFPNSSPGLVAAGLRDAPSRASGAARDGWRGECR